MPGVMITDKGSEYISENFEQITELGIRLIDLPSYRPELKGSVEKFFDLIQNSFKTVLKGKGVIEPDFKKGAHTTIEKMLVSHWKYSKKSCYIASFIIIVDAYWKITHSLKRCFLLT